MEEGLEKMKRGGGGREGGREGGGEGRGRGGWEEEEQGEEEGEMHFLAAGNRAL